MCRYNVTKHFLMMFVVTFNRIEINPREKKIKIFQFHVAQVFVRFFPIDYNEILDMAWSQVEGAL